MGTSITYATPNAASLGLAKENPYISQLKSKPKRAGSGPLTAINEDSQYSSEDIDSTTTDDSNDSSGYGGITASFAGKNLKDAQKANSKQKEIGVKENDYCYSSPDSMTCAAHKSSIDDVEANLPQSQTLTNNDTGYRSSFDNNSIYYRPISLKKRLSAQIAMTIPE